MIERLKESFGAAIGFKVVGRITGDEVKAFEPQIEFVIARTERAADRDSCRSFANGGRGLEGALG